MITTAVILAAGSSRRMGRPKLLMPWRYSPILETTITNVRQSNVDHILIVTGAHRPQTESIGRRHHIPTAHNPDYATGEMLSSLKVAIRHAPPATRALLVMMGDMPLIPAEIIDLLIDSHHPGTITAPVIAGTRGHPVIFDHAFFSQILDLPTTATPRAILQQHSNALNLVPVTTPSVLIDIDTLELYEKYRPR